MEAVVNFASQISLFLDPISVCNFATTETYLYHHLSPIRERVVWSLGGEELALPKREMLCKRCERAWGGEVVVECSLEVSGKNSDVFFLAPNKQWVEARSPRRALDYSRIVYGDSSSIESDLCEHFKHTDIVVRPIFVVACNILFCFATAETL